MHGPWYFCVLLTHSMPSFFAHIFHVQVYSFCSFGTFVIISVKCYKKIYRTLQCNYKDDCYIRSYCILMYTCGYFQSWKLFYVANTPCSMLMILEILSVYKI